MAINIVTFKIMGLSPILMNNPISMSDDDSKGVKARTKKESPEVEAQKGLYVMEDGMLYVPSIAFRASLWYGSSYQKIGKESARNMIQAACFTIEEKTPLLDPSNEKPIKSYEIDSRTVVIKATGGRVMRHRPKVPEWMCLLPLEIDTDYITPEIITTLFNRAGKITGILDYRPANRGWFGRYQVEIYNGAGSAKRKKIKM